MLTCCDARLFPLLMSDLLEKTEIVRVSSFLDEKSAGLGLERGKQLLVSLGLDLEDGKGGETYIDSDGGVNLCVVSFVSLSEERRGAWLERPRLTTAFDALGRAMDTSVRANTDSRNKG